MKKFIETIKNIWHIEDLRTRLLITLAFAAMYRFGSFIVLPGINPEALTALREQTNTGLMSLLNMFSGGAFSNSRHPSSSSSLLSWYLISRRCSAKAKADVVR